MANNKIDFEALDRLVDSKIKDSVGSSFSRLKKERETVLRYYNGEYPKKQHAASASFTTSDVYNGVEMAKASIADIYLTNSQIIEFTPEGPEDVRGAQLESQYTQYVFFRQNQGEKNIIDWLDDGLKARIAVAEVYWKDDQEIEEREFDVSKAIDDATLDALVEHPEVEELDAERDPKTGFFEGTISRVKENRSQVVVDVVPPEEFFCDPYARTLVDGFHGRRTRMSKAEMRQQGWDTSKLRDLKPDGDDDSETATEAQARVSQIDPGYESSAGRSGGLQDRYWVYDCYIPVDTDTRTCLYKVVRVQNVSLERKEVKRSRFKTFAPLPVAHSVFGNSFAMRLVPTQQARTTLSRGILDHTAITTNPRMIIRAGGLANPREFYDNKGLGGSIQVNMDGAIQPMQYPNLNPFTFQTLAALQAEGEQTSGISALMQGLDKAAISTQNSSSLVNTMIEVGATRNRLIARHFGRFLKEIFLEISDLIRENDRELKRNFLDVAGDYVDVDPRTWKERKDAEVTIHLDPADAQAENMQIGATLQMAMQNDTLARMVGEKGLYAFGKRWLQNIGFKDVPTYLTPPDQLPPAAPDQMAMKQLELQERQIAAQETAVQTERMKVQAKYELDMFNAQQDAKEAEFRHEMARREADRKDLDVASRIENNGIETQLLVDASANASPETRGVISPT